MKRHKKRNNDVTVNTPVEPADALEKAVESLVDATNETVAEPKRRQLIVVDLETTGTHDAAVPVEVAAINVDTGEKLYFVPHVTQEALSKAEPKAMQINRYYERGLFEQALTVDQTAGKYRELQEMLSGNTFAGSNPAFDSRILAAVKVARLMPSWWYEDPRPTGMAAANYTNPFGRPWHRRLADLSAYAAGKLDIELDDLPGLDAVVERLCGAVEVDDRHTAMGDAATTAACFEMLRNMKSYSWGDSTYLLTNMFAQRSSLWAGR